MRIKTLHELSYMIEKYNNPMILSFYKGEDWHNYTSFYHYNFKNFQISRNLFLVNCLSNQSYKINNKDVIKVLNGSLLINMSKVIDEDENSYIFDFYKNNEKNNINDIYLGLEGKVFNKNIYGICSGKSLYNTFLHYKNL